MKNIIVIYESKYGYTKRYAEWIAEALSCPLFEKKSITTSDLEKADTIIYGGGLYAGGVSGIKLLIDNWNLISNKKIALFTCGLANPKEPENVTNIRAGIRKTLPQEMFEKLTFFHFCGGIDYSRLNLIHKGMMAMIHKMLLKKDESELTYEDKGLLDTYGGAVDFTDKESIRPLIEWV